MYEFITRNQICATRDEVRKKRMEEALNVMRNDISKFLSDCLEEAKRGNYVDFESRHFRFPNVLDNGGFEKPVFPAGIMNELQEAGFDVKITELYPHEYFLTPRIKKNIWPKYIPAVVILRRGFFFRNAPQVPWFIQTIIQ